MYQRKNNKKRTKYNIGKTEFVWKEVLLSGKTCFCNMMDNNRKSKVLFNI